MRDRLNWDDIDSPALQDLCPGCGRALDSENALFCTTCDEDTGFDTDDFLDAEIEGLEEWDDTD